MKIADWILDLVKQAKHTIEDSGKSSTWYKVDFTDTEEYNKVSDSLMATAKDNLDYSSDDQGIVEIVPEDEKNILYVKVIHGGTYDKGKEILDATIANILGPAKESGYGFSICKVAAKVKHDGTISPEYPTQKRMREEVTFEKGHTAADFEIKKKLDKKEFGNPSVETAFPKSEKEDTDGIFDKNPKHKKETKKPTNEPGETDAVTHPTVLDKSMILKKVDEILASGGYLVDLDQKEDKTPRGGAGHITYDITASSSDSILIEKTAAKSLDYAKYLLEGNEGVPEEIITKIIADGEALDFALLLVEHGIQLPKRIEGIVLSEPTYATEYAQTLIDNEERVSDKVLNSFVNNPSAAWEYGKKLLDSGKKLSEDIISSINKDQNVVSEYISYIIELDKKLDDKVMKHIKNNAPLAYTYAVELLKKDKNVPEDIIDIIISNKSSAGAYVNYLQEHNKQIPKELEETVESDEMDTVKENLDKIV